jgi:hypothetical protein
MGDLCEQRNWSMAIWDIDRGLQVAGQDAPGSTDSIAAIRSVSAMAKPDRSALPRGQG